MRGLVQRLKAPFEEIPRVRHVVMLALLGVVVLLSFWLFRNFWGMAHLRDELIARKYEGSLSEDLGFIVSLTSEVSREYNFNTPSELRRTESIRKVLVQAKNRLESLRPSASRSQGVDSSRSLEEIQDENSLLQLLSSPMLANLSSRSLGLDVVRLSELPSYPALETSKARKNPVSFVFIPAPLIDQQGNILNPRLRRDLVFSKLVESDLRAVLASTSGLYQAYYISCGDFVRLINTNFKNQRLGYAGKFSPLRSLADRTYFRETRLAPSRFRQSEPYIDVTGGGLVNTYSIFVDNSELGVCGMIGVDRQLEPLSGLWEKLSLGGGLRPMRNFDFATYIIATHQIESRSNLAREVRSSLVVELGERTHEIENGIHRIQTARATVFTVPIGQGKIACFVYDRVHTERIYALLFGGAITAFLLFLLMALLESSIQRDANAARQLQSEIIANLHGGFVIVDDKDQIEIKNERFIEMVDGPVHGRLITSFLAPESANEYLHLKAAGAGFEFSGRLRGERGLSPVIITSAPVTFREKSNRRMLILIDSSRLEQTIARKFLNIFSHALKSPVHSIILIADLFRRKNALAKFDYYYSQMEQKVQEFSTLTDNVLRFSTLDIKEISLHKSAVNVARVMRKVLSAARERAKARGLCLEESLSGDLRAEADPDLLHIVFNNLVDNALKYTPSGTITIQSQDLLTHIRIVVADTGPGVPIRDRDNIFDLFYQGTRPGASSREGLGLGLYISRRYIEAMGGRLWYEPILEPGAGEILAGSRFIIELPKHEGGRQREPEAEGSAA
jgi:signal transduction histidine kinase